MEYVEFQIHNLLNLRIALSTMFRIILRQCTHLHCQSIRLATETRGMKNYFVTRNLFEIRVFSNFSPKETFLGAENKHWQPKDDLQIFLLNSGWMPTFRSLGKFNWSRNLERNILRGTLKAQTFESFLWFLKSLSTPVSWWNDGVEQDE